MYCKLVEAVVQIKYIYLFKKKSVAAGKGGGGGIFQYGRHSDYKNYYWETETKLT